MSDGFALGIGLTNECNLACDFCYRDPTRTDRLTLDQVRSILERIQVRSINLGTGENGMHPEFKTILGYLRKLAIKLTITSNGHSVAILSDSELRAFHDIEFSLDYPNEQEQDVQRGSGNWSLVHEQAARCVRLGVPVTIVAVMMRSNHLRLAEIARVARRFGAPLRINVYQAVRSDLYALTYEEYWAGFMKLFTEADALAIGEPLASDGRDAAAHRWMRLRHRSRDAASHRSALCLLAGRRPGAGGGARLRRRNCQLAPFRAGASASEGMRGMRVS